jgi:hypothetical protein
VVKFFYVKIYKKLNYDIIILGRTSIRHLKKMEESKRNSELNGILLKCSQIDGINLLNEHEKLILNDFLIRKINYEDMKFIKNYSNLILRIVLKDEFGFNNDDFIFYTASYRMVLYMSSLMEITIVEFCKKFFVQLYIDAYYKLVPFYIRGTSIDKEMKLNPFENEIVSFIGEPEQGVSIYDNILNGRIPLSKHKLIIDILDDCCGLSLDFKNFLKSYILNYENDFNFLIHLLEILIGKEISNDEKLKLLELFSSNHAEFNQMIEDLFR